jgi:hypothetical protein
MQVNYLFEAIPENYFGPVRYFMTKYSKWMET